MTDIRAARAALRGIQEKWEQVGGVPRESREQLEGGLRKVEDAVRKAEDNQWRKSNPEAIARAEGTVNQLRSAIEQLEQQLAQGQGEETTPPPSATPKKPWKPAAAGWREAERTLAEFSG